MNWLGQFDRVPLDAADARHVALVDLREHVVQAVAELVEQRGHVVVREQRRLAVDAFGEVADQLRDRASAAVPVSGRSQRARTSSIQAPPRLPARAEGSR